MKLKIRTILIFIISLAILSFSTVLVGKTIYVKSFKVNMTETPQKGAKKLLVLKRGLEVKKLKVDKSWVKIRYKNTEGWVHKFALSDIPPRKRISLLFKKVDITSKARKRASTFTSAAAARGLVVSDKDSLVAREKHDFVALAKMENVMVDPEQAILFITEDE